MPSYACPIASGPNFPELLCCVAGVGNVTYVVRANLATSDVVEYSHLDGVKGSGFGRGMEWFFMGGLSFVRLFISSFKVELQSLAKLLRKQSVLACTVIRFKPT